MPQIKSTKRIMIYLFEIDLWHLASSVPNAFLTVESN